jgi:hypothetical protein
MVALLSSVIPDMPLVGLALFLALGVMCGGDAVVVPRPVPRSSGPWTYTTGDARLDARLRAEATSLARVFGVLPNLVLFEDAQSPNAYASERATAPLADGTVAIGLTLIARELGQGERGEQAVASILAHEWSHILQIRQRCTLVGTARELHADFLAGYYLGRRYGGVADAVVAAGRAVYRQGDYLFGDGNHHGTPIERVQALMQGFLHSHLSLPLAYQLGERWALTLGSGATAAFAAAWPVR